MNSIVQNLNYLAFATTGVWAFALPYENMLIKTIPTIPYNTYGFQICHPPFNLA